MTLQNLLSSSLLFAIAVFLPMLAFAQAPQGGSASDAWMTAPPTSTGIAVGQKIPAFRAPDQSGKMRDFNSIRGPKGAAIYFNRSADW
jgi:hypothetical protein